MFKAEAEQQGTRLNLRFLGTVDETFRLEAIDPRKVKELHVHCKGVVRINSMGVKAWFKFFQAVQGQKIPVTFHECSTAVVEHFNQTQGSLAGAKVESVMVPFSCDACHSDLVGFFRVEALRKAGFEVPPLDCPKCGGSAHLDDFPDEYFGFLKKG